MIPPLLSPPDKVGPFTKPAMSGRGVNGVFAPRMKEAAHRSEEGLARHESWPPIGAGRGYGLEATGAAAI